MIRRAVLKEPRGEQKGVLLLAVHVPHPAKSTNDHLRLHQRKITLQLTLQERQHSANKLINLVTGGHRT